MFFFSKKILKVTTTEREHLILRKLRESVIFSIMKLKSLINTKVIKNKHKISESFRITRISECVVPIQNLRIKPKS